VAKAIHSIPLFVLDCSSSSSQHLPDRCSNPSVSSSNREQRISSNLAGSTTIFNKIVVSGKQASRYLPTCAWMKVTRSCRGHSRSPFERTTTPTDIEDGAGVLAEYDLT
jgi:hypothetical protein